MKYFKAIITEKTAPLFGQSFANTKNGKYKEMSLEQFAAAIKYVQAFTFEIVEII